MRVTGNMISFKMKITSPEAQEKIIKDVKEREVLALVMQTGGVSDEQSQWAKNQRAQLVATALGKIQGISDLQSLRRSDCSGGFSYIQFTLPSSSVTYLTVSAEYRVARHADTRGATAPGGG